MTSPPRTTRHAALAAAIGCVAILATGCGPSGTPSPIGSAATSAAPTAGTAPGSAAASGANGAGANTGGTNTGGTNTTAAPGTATRPAPCPTRYLQVKTGVSQGTAGSTYTVLDFTNISSTTCTLYGYPGVSLAGGTPVTQIGLAAAENPATPRVLVSLAPGATANALLRIADAGNYPAAQCHPVTATYLQIFPPNQTTPSYLAYTRPACAGPERILTVDAVRAGAGSAS